MLLILWDSNTNSVLNRALNFKAPGFYLFYECQSSKRFLLPLTEHLVIRTCDLNDSAQALLGKRFREQDTKLKLTQLFFLTFDRQFLIQSWIMPVLRNCTQIDDSNNFPEWQTVDFQKFFIGLLLPIKAGGMNYKTNTNFIACDTCLNKEKMFVGFYHHRCKESKQQQNTKI